MSSRPDGGGGRTPDGLPPDSVLFGGSAAMQQLKRSLLRVCAAPVPILFEGEIGVGKRILARFVHQNLSARGDYIAVNCATLSQDWGLRVVCAALNHGVTSVARGTPVEDAAGIPTLFLDQVCDLPARLQGQIANLLADHADRRANHQEHRVSRIISASTRNLRREVRKGRFRRDVFDRLGVVTITLPPLRNRMEDLPAIASYLRTHYTAQLGVEDRQFPPDLLARMRAYGWPGNIRELESFVCQYVVEGYSSWTTLGKADFANALQLSERVQ